MARKSGQITLELGGVKTLINDFNKFPSDIKTKLLKDIVLFGAKILRDEVKEKAPVGLTGRLKDAIVARRAKVDSLFFEEQARVLVSRKKKADVFYGHLVEFGHAVIGKRGGKTIFQSHEPPQPFMEPAFRASHPRITREMLAKLKKGMILQAKKINKKSLTRKNRR